MMRKDKERELQMSEFLLQIKAIKLNVDKPFTWASGWKSPIYCDNRITLSYPPIRTYIRQQLVNLIENEYGMPDVIAGVATGAIGIGALVAHEMNLPFVYVRANKKGHGLANQIEGIVDEGQTVVVIEDLISTGMSSLNAVAALRDKGCDVRGMLSIFTYGFDVAVEAFEKEKCDLIALTNYNRLIQQAASNNYILEDDIKTLKEWRKNPSTWKQE